MVIESSPDSLWQDAYRAIVSRLVASNQSLRQDWVSAARWLNCDRHVVVVRIVDADLLDWGMRCQLDALYRLCTSLLVGTLEPNGFTSRFLPSRVRRYGLRSLFSLFLSVQITVTTGFYIGLVCMVWKGSLLLFGLFNRIAYLVESGFSYYISQLFWLWELTSLDWCGARWSFSCRFALIIPLVRLIDTCI